MRSERDEALVVSGEEVVLELVEDDAVWDSVVAVKADLLVPLRSSCGRLV